MKTKVSILFYAKKAKAAANGLVPIYTRITINGKRIELSTNRFVEISKWSTLAGKMKGTSEEARSINNHLDILKSQIRDVEMELIHRKIAITTETIKSKLLGTDERARMLVPIFQDHNNKIKELVGKEYAPGTLERYTTSLKHTIEFMQWKYNIPLFLNCQFRISSLRLKNVVLSSSLPKIDTLIPLFLKILCH